MIYVALVTLANKQIKHAVFYAIRVIAFPREALTPNKMFTLPTGYGIAIILGHPNRAKV